MPSKIHGKWNKTINQWEARKMHELRRDLDQSGHLPSLIRVFAVRMKKAWILSYPLSASEDSDQTEQMPRLIWIFAGCTLILLVLSCCMWLILTVALAKRTKLKHLHLFYYHGILNHVVYWTLVHDYKFDELPYIVLHSEYGCGWTNEFPGGFCCS